MANAKSKQVGRALIVDPNPPNNGTTNIEDLNIIVQLEAVNKRRSILDVTSSSTASLTGTNGNDRLIVNFLEGTEVNDKRVLTTSYTELGGINENDGQETFGITNIEIEFTSTYTPVVKINFTDIRGRLFELGNDSPLNVFFNLPYPIFKLKIKGYYGKSITYCLHLLKFNAKFDSTTGNFNIVGEFTGYTYAFLSDMLLGYLRAIPETSFFKPIDGFIPLNTLIERSKDFNTNIEKLRQTDEDIINLKFNETILNDLGVVENFVKSGLNGLSSLIPATNNGVKVINGFQSVEALNIFQSKVNEYHTALETVILNYNEGKSTRYQLTTSSFMFNIDKNITLNNLTTQITNTTILNDVQTIFRINGGLNNITVVSVIDGVNRINNIREFVINDNKETTNNVSNTLSETVRDSFGFTPSIKEITRIFINHVESFMTAIRDTAILAENNLVGRKAAVQTNFPDFINSIDDIYPFPTYTKSDNSNGRVDGWLGDDYGPDIFPEIRLVEEVIEGLLKVIQADNRFNRLGTKTEIWYPVNPLDTPLFVSNPWEINFPNGPSIMFNMINRAFIFLGYSNREVEESEIVTMGKLEANNCFTKLENDILKDVIVDYNTRNVTNIVDRVIEQATTLNGFNLGTSTQGRPFMVKNVRTFGFTGGRVDVFEYNNLSNDVNGNNINILPLIKPFSLESPTFFGSYITTSETDETVRDDDGGSYIRILDNISDNFVLPDYAVNIRENRSLTVNELNSGNLSNFSQNGGYLGSQDFLTSTLNIGGNMVEGSGAYIFYDLDDELIVSTFNDDTSTMMNPLRIGGGSQQADQLFGSHLYYGQTSEEAKALLFLNSLPFIGKNSGESGFSQDSVMMLFNNRASFMKVPFSWLLFIGGMLWRNEQPVDPIIYEIDVPNLNGPLVLPYKTGSFNVIPPTTSQYLYNTGNASVVYSVTFNNYREIERELLLLPNQVKSELIEIFENWVSNPTGWLEIKREGEIFRDNITVDEIGSLFLNLHNNVTVDTSGPLFNNNFTNNYLEIIPREFSRYYTNFPNTSRLLENMDNSSTYLSAIRAQSAGDESPYHFNLIQKSDSTYIRTLQSFLREERVLVNTTWRLWNEDGESGFRIPDETNISATFTVRDANLRTYISSFVTEFKRLRREELEGAQQNQLNRQIFNTINNTDIKINVYNTLKSIYDKWVSGQEGITDFCVNTTPNEGNPSESQLLNSFKFIDRSYLDIGDELLINPINLIDKFTSDLNQSFYTFYTTLLRDNNVDFIPLPNFINYNDETEIEDVFNTFTYDEGINSSMGPQFVCMYIGERDKDLDLGQQNNYKPCSLSFPSLEDGDENLSDEFSVTTGDGDNDLDNVPVFLVNYGSQNQSIFKDIELNQTEFTETEESLWNVEQLSKRGSSGNSSAIGQNLYNIYRTRAYTTQIECLGNMQIQPFMYFQLNSIPMFNGAYNIINVKHSIKPNHITTKFKGVKIGCSKTKLVSESNVFMNLLGSLADVPEDNPNIDTSSSTRDANTITGVIIDE